MIEIDLLPEALRSPAAGAQRVGPGRGGRGFDLWGTALVVAAITIPPGTAFLWRTQRSEAAALHARLEAASADSVRLAGLRAASDSLAERSRQIGERVALVAQLDHNRFTWPRILDEISWALPGLAWLISLRQVAPPPDVTVELQGVAANPLAITRFARNLDASEYVADVQILGSRQQAVPSQESAARHAFTFVLRFADPPGVRRVEPIIGSGGG